MGGSAILSLLWTRALIHTLGSEVYGLYMAFVAVALLGGLGDLGLSGAMGTRMIGHLARGEDQIGRRFLASARGMFLVIAVILLFGFLILAPWLPGWLRFENIASAGSLSLLFALGGIGGAIVVLGGYFQNLNYIHGNVVWPIVPAFVATQFSFAAQWTLAKQGVPLWAQYAAQLCVAAASLIVAVWMLRISHDWLGDLLPVRWEAVEMRSLAATSFWTYLCSLGSMVYLSTDQILVNAGFGAEAVPGYRFNYKLCEMGLLLLSSASFVAMPAIVQRLLNTDAGVRRQGLDGVHRLQSIQTTVACMASAGYLLVNDFFISMWVGQDFRGSVLLQSAFALNLAVTMSGDVGVQLRGRLNFEGVRVAGLAVGGTGILNLLLSLLAVKMGWMVGIAIATVVAQSVLNLVMNQSLCREIGISWLSWMIRSWLLPLVVVLLAVGARVWLPPDSTARLFWLIAIDIILVVAVAMALGVRRQMIVDEWQRLRASFR